MDKMKKFAKIGLCIAIALMLISMIVVSIVQTDGGKVTIKQLTIETDNGYTLSANLYIPANATAETPAPAIVTSHGALNNKEMQDANFVELSRRGYVVLAVDQPNHGNSEIAGTSVSYSSVYQGVLVLSRLPFVDVTKIGVTGHSMGGVSSNRALALDNANETQLIAAALLNCADATYTDTTTQEFINIYGSRDIAVIAVVYDEFFHTSTDADGNKLSSPYFMATAKAQSFLYFGQDPTGLEEREADTVYTEVIDGVSCERVIYRPAIIHPWSHFSTQATARVIEFFDRALGAPIEIASSNQVWPVKEAFNLIGAIGFVAFLACFAILMVFTPMFSSLRATEVAQPTLVTDKKRKLWFWGSLSAGALFSMLIYVWILQVGTAATYVSQTESYGIGLWAALCGVFAIVSMIVYYLFYGRKNGFDLEKSGVKIAPKKLAKTALLAVIVAAVGYAWVFFADYFFNTDFRFWTLAIKVFEANKIGIALWPYLWLFMIFYVAVSVSANAFNYNSIGGKHEIVNNLIVSFITALPAIVLPMIQYFTYFSTKSMVWTTIGDAMHILWLFPIILILFASTFISRYIYKATRNPYLAGIINAIVVTLMTVTNTSTKLM